ncbi:hypothetical protein RO787_14765, partial [Blautia coccoides]|uniref:hypothetical protein n=1 Tax=Blautia producta TaxID=33035 RepID=UPI0028A3237B
MNSNLSFFYFFCFSFLPPLRAEKARRGMGEDRGRELRGSDVRWSTGEIHLPQSLNEEASADEFSEWEQVSSMAAELFAPTQLSPPVLSHTSPSP